MSKKIKLNVAYNIRHSYVSSADSLFCLFSAFIMAFNKFLRQTVLLLGLYTLTVLSLLKKYVLTKGLFHCYKKVHRIFKANTCRFS
jgi:hypothetical protein